MPSRHPLRAALVALTGSLLLVTALPAASTATTSPASSSPASSSRASSSPAARAGARAAAPAFRVATFNLLGASHTKRGRQARLGSGKARMARSVRILKRRDIGLVGFQEMQRSQVDEFLRRRDRTWDLYPGTALRDLDGENSIGWRTDRWRLLKAATVPIPYFNGNVRQMPLLLLQHRASGRRVYVMNVHNPATNRRVGNQDTWRKLALAKEIETINALRLSTRLPVILVGDLNDRELAFCPLYRNTSLRAANGGSATATTCTLPRPTPVDWVMGTIGVRFTSYTKLDTKFVRRTTDHPVVYADVRLGDPSDLVAP